MRIIVIGAGAWGLPTAAELARRGHDVIILDRHGPGNTLSSSSGPTRLWRVADPDPAAIRLGRRAQEAMARLEGRLGKPVHTSTGLLWRDESQALEAMARSVAAEGVDHREIPAATVGGAFPGLRADHRDALWLPEAGSLLSAEAIAGYLRLFEDAGGETRFGSTVAAISASTRDGGVVSLHGEAPLHADVVVMCAGPGTPALLATTDLSIPLRPYVEQVVHVGADQPSFGAHLPCLFDGPGEHGPGVFCMPTPGVGYKVGIDGPLRELLPGDDDRSPDAGRTRAILDRFDTILPVAGRRLVDEFVCCWTDSLDGWFAVDRTATLVVACGDAGKGFKYSPAMGEILADLAEGEQPDPDVAAMSASRFEGRHFDPAAGPTTLGHTRS